jgi:hypothetical protein
MKTGVLRYAMLLLGICVAARADATGRHAMTATAPSPVARSITAYRMILDDIEKTYRASGGGGIASIRETETNVYVVKISQEERSDMITYRFRRTPGGVELIERSEASQSH